MDKSSNTFSSATWFAIAVWLVAGVIAFSAYGPIAQSEEPREKISEAKKDSQLMESREIDM